MRDRVEAPSEARLAVPQARERGSRPGTAWLRALLLGWLLLQRPAGAAGEEPITPVPTAARLDAGKVRLGERLFHDTRLSRGDDLACASCHALDKGGDDGRARSEGADGAPLDFNAPTVLNAALSARLNWRGNFRTLEEQAEAVLLDPRLMGMDWPELLARLEAGPGYARDFRKLYGSGPEPWQVLDALAAFERSLLTPGSRFDRHLAGEPGAMTAEEEEGYGLFKTYGCIACHQGVNVGGNLFQRFGIFLDPLAGRPTLTPADQGRFALTGQERDRRVFRVPSLRNVALTAPYFHDGSAATLEEAVTVMARSQLGRTLAKREVGLITAFLRTLTGEPLQPSSAAEAGRPP
jgi:cytochrome c peroxidase